MFECEYGSVEYEFEEMPGCCGVGILYDIDFRPNKRRDIKKLYEAFDDYIFNKPTQGNGFDIDYNHRDALSKSKLLMSDGVAPQGPIYWCSIAAFCRHTGWMEGTARKNFNSGNNVIVFEKDRPQKK